MRKHTTLKRLLFLGSFALALLLIGSCKKDLLMDDNPNNFAPIPSAKLTAVKQWYSRNEGLITSEYNWLNSLSPKWDSVRVQNNEKGSVYEAVLHNPDKIFATDGKVNLKDSRKKYAQKSTIRLLIFRDELGQSYRSCFMEVIATGENELPRQLSYMNYGNLSGLVSFYELDGRLANSWVYSNGKAVMSTTDNSGLRSGRSASSKSGAIGRIMFDDGPPEGYIDCGNRLVAHTREVCGEVGGLEGGGYEGGEGSGKICREEMYFVSERIYCPIVGGGSGEGEYETPNPSGPGGGGNGNGLSQADIDSAQVVEDGKPKIQDIKKYIDCFTDGKVAQSYTMTIFVDQPVPGQSDAFKIVTPTGGTSTNPYGVPTGIVFQTPSGGYFDVGHTFVTFEKNNTDGTNVRQTLGFYPGGNTFASAGAMEDNSGHVADVKYTMSVSALQFNQALQKVESDFASKKYVLHNIFSSEYNCTDAAISWMNAAGANFSNSSSVFFKNTPGAFGQLLKDKPGAVVNPTSGITGKGPCN